MNVSSLSMINNAMLSSIYQGNMAMASNRLNRSSFPPMNNMAGQGFPQLNFGDAQYVTDIRESASALSSSLRELSGPAWNQRTVTSSNTDVMTVAFSGNRPNSVSSMTVNVDQVARGQRNESVSVRSTDRYEGQSGTNTIAISIGGKTTNISANINSTDSNITAQRKMADAINNAGIGVRATVVTDSETNTSSLRLESVNTGTDPRNSFTVSDVRGNFAEQTNIRQMTSAGQDAIYRVNGGEAQTSRTNTVNLGNGVTATLRQESNESVTVAPGRDQNAARNAINDMVRSYNNLFSAAAENTNDPRAQNLASRLLNTARIYAGSLNEIGINFDNSGRMRIDNERMNQAMQSGRLETFFTENSGRNFGFTNQMGRLADNVSRNPANFVTNSLFGGNLSGNFGYSGFGNLMQFNSLAAGSLMDFML